MNKLNGQLFDYYGFVLIKYSGVLNMPGRIGDHVYDWGDYSEPLVHQDDIYWKSRQFSMNVLFDKKRTLKTFNEVINELYSLDEFLLESNYGNFTVKIKEINRVISHGNAIQLSIVFHEKTPVFSGVLKGKVGGNGILIDGYDLWNDFGIKVSEISEFDYLPELKSTNTTVFKSSKEFSSHRNLKVLELKCSMPFSDKGKFSETTEMIKKLLSQDGYRILNLKSENYNCFFSKGFEVRLFKNHVEFDLEFNLIQSFVQKHFIDFGFVN